jgi:hypothetical protein
LLGQGSNGAAFGGGGSGGTNGQANGLGGEQGGGGGGSSTVNLGYLNGTGRHGGVRIIWGSDRSFPSTNTGNL